MRSTWQEWIPIGKPKCPITNLGRNYSFRILKIASINIFEIISPSKQICNILYVYSTEKQFHLNFSALKNCIEKKTAFINWRGKPFCQRLWYEILWGNTLFLEDYAKIFTLCNIVFVLPVARGPKGRTPFSFAPKRCRIKFWVWLWSSKIQKSHVILRRRRGKRIFKNFLAFNRLLRKITCFLEFLTGTIRFRI